MTQEKILEELVRIRRRLGAAPMRLHSFEFGDGSLSNPARTLAPKTSGVFGELHKTPFGGLILFATVASTAKTIDQAFEVDDTVRHTSSMSALVDGTFTIGHSPGIIMMQTSPAFVAATSFGDTTGLPFSRSLRFVITNTGTSAVILLRVVLRVLEHLD